MATFNFSRGTQQSIIDPSTFKRFFQTEVAEIMGEQGYEKSICLQLTKLKNGGNPWVLSVLETKNQGSSIVDFVEVSQNSYASKTIALPIAEQLYFDLIAGKSVASLKETAKETKKPKVTKASKKAGEGVVASVNANKTSNKLTKDEKDLMEARKSEITAKKAAKKSAKKGKVEKKVTTTINKNPINGQDLRHFASVAKTFFETSKLEKGEKSHRIDILGGKYCIMIGSEINYFQPFFGDQMLKTEPNGNFYQAMNSIIKHMKNPKKAGQIVKQDLIEEQQPSYFESKIFEDLAIAISGKYHDGRALDLKFGKKSFEKAIVDTGKKFLTQLDRSLWQEVVCDIASGNISEYKNLEGFVSFSSAILTVVSKNV